MNQEWIKGYEVQTSRSGHYVSDAVLSHVVVVSISGGINDYQVFFYLHLALCDVVETEILNVAAL